VLYRVQQLVCAPPPPDLVHLELVLVLSCFLFLGSVPRNFSIGGSAVFSRDKGGYAGTQTVLFPFFLSRRVFIRHCPVSRLHRFLKFIFRP